MQMQKKTIIAISKKLVDRKTGLIHPEDNRCLYIENSSVIEYEFREKYKNIFLKKKKMNQKYEKMAESKCHLRILYSIKILIQI